MHDIAVKGFQGVTQLCHLSDTTMSGFWRHTTMLNRLHGRAKLLLCSGFYDTSDFSLISAPLSPKPAFEPTMKNMKQFSTNIDEFAYEIGLNEGISRTKICIIKVISQHHYMVSRALDKVIKMKYKVEGKVIMTKFGHFGLG